MPLARRAAGATAAVSLATLGTVLLPSAAHAHSLDSSTISLHVSDTEADATVTIALATLDQALGTDYSSEADVSSYSDEVVAYLVDHLEVTAADGTVWAEAFSSVSKESVEGIDSLSVDVTFDTGGASTSGWRSSTTPSSRPSPTTTQLSSSPTPPARSARPVCSRAATPR